MRICKFVQDPRVACSAKSDPARKEAQRRKPACPPGPMDALQQVSNKALAECHTGAQQQRERPRPWRDL